MLSLHTTYSTHQPPSQILFPRGSTVPLHSTATALSLPPMGARYFIVPRTINSKFAAIHFFHFSGPSVAFTAGPTSFICPFCVVYCSRLNDVGGKERGASNVRIVPNNNDVPSVTFLGGCGFLVGVSPHGGQIE